MKHSPAPWGTMAGMPANVLDATGCRIAWFNSNDYHSPSTPQDEANARLAAAAPDLLEALRDLETWWSNWMPDDARSQGGREALENARAAIAKAEAIR